MNKASFFILNIFLNSFLAFLTVAFLIEGVIFLFRIRQGRVTATLRMIPIIKLPLDLFLYDFSRWSYTQGINPSTCEEGTRTLSVIFGGMNSMTNGLILPVASGIQFTVPGNMTFTIADLIGYTSNPIFLNIFAFLFIIVTITFVFNKIFFYYRSLITLNSLTLDARPLYRKMRNSALSSRIRKYKVRILTSPFIKGSPFVAGLISSIIYIPSHLLNSLSRKEYEAVLAHEIEHVKYKDSLVRVILDLIGSVFWWIPTKWLRHRIEEGQEIECDLKCKFYGIELTNLASAICKSAKYSINTHHIFAHHLTKYTILKRVNILLHPPSIRFKKTRFTFTCLAFGIAFLMIFLGRFWTF